MGKISRIACIATPGLLTIASLICLALIFSAGLQKSNSTLSNFYFLRINTTQFKSQVFVGISALQGSTVNNNFLSALNAAFTSGKVADIYDVYLTNYCSGPANGTLTACSEASKDFYFNPIEIWGLNGTDGSGYVPTALTDGLKIYQKVAVWMFIAYSVALWATVVAFVTGFLAICTRWGSALTAVVMSVATLFTVLAAVTSTVLFSTLNGTGSVALKPYGITLEQGTQVLACEWIGVAFSVAAWVFWVASICCCSGRSHHGHSKRSSGAGKRGHYDGEMGSGALQSGFHGLPFGQQGRGYQPLEGSQYGHGHGQQPSVELNQWGHQGGAFKGRDETAYEPFRPR